MLTIITANANNGTPTLAQSGTRRLRQGIARIITTGSWSSSPRNARRATTVFFAAALAVALVGAALGIRLLLTREDSSTVGEDIRTSFGLIHVAPVKTFAPLKTHHGSFQGGLPASSRDIQLQTAITLANLGDRPVPYRARMFHLRTAPGRPRISTTTEAGPGELLPQATIALALTFDIPKSAQRLSLEFDDPGRPTPIVIDLGVPGRPPAQQQHDHS